jgi:hypothetical protein
LVIILFLLLLDVARLANSSFLLGLQMLPGIEKRFAAAPAFT